MASTKTELESTIADLKRARGDLDNTSSLVATNGKELQALKALGERNYIEFTITKSKEAHKVGDVMVLLKKTDPKKNKFTIELVADDKSVEKKDRAVNEPLAVLRRQGAAALRIGGQRGSQGRHRRLPLDTEGPAVAVNQARLSGPVGVGF